MDKLPIRIVSVDDDIFWLNTCEELLHLSQNEKYRFEVVAKSTFGKPAIDLVLSHKPDIVLLDLKLPDIYGYDLGLLLKALPDPPKILFLSCLADELSYQDIAGQGFSGYTTRGKIEELRSAIIDIYEGRAHLGRDVGSAMLKKSLQANEAKSVAPIQPPAPEIDKALLSWIALLTPTEKVVFEYFERGLSQGLIAKEMGLKPSSVKTHLKHLREKSSFLTLDEFRIFLAKRKTKR